MEAGQPLKKPPGYGGPATPSPLQPGRPTMPPPSYYKPMPRKRKNYRPFTCRRCCCWCLCIFLFILILFAVAGGIFYLWFQPRSPIFRFRPIEINRFNITKQPGSDTARLDSQAVIRVEVKNPNNKLRIYYGNTAVTLTADQDTELGSAAVAAFVQPTNNVTMLKFATKVENGGIDVTVADALAARVQSKTVVITAAVKTKVGIGVGKLKLGMLAVNVNCGDVSLKQLNDAHASPKCTFTTLRW
ncbi:hypothetical protein Cgig2_000516 [Carnegiea gigantea]|uniref:Late embryogenesis abundant protein LEA-2 subgroup domain-containing protein n=1 Tax=Carnegiea gigantea TaxID=171969 RepID=A0A9Q1GTD4_9CARY|nr:hypothetical protein Cgig2_000516 [Carnegiea gigantea]